MESNTRSQRLSFGTGKPFSWSHDYLFTVLTTGKSRLVKSANLVTAFKMIDRADFVPHEYQTEAYNDTDIPIGYSEVVDKPTVIAQMLQILKPKEGGVYLDIGSGSGYVAALLGVAAGSKGKVFTLERKQFLADIARINLHKYPFLGNVELVFRDGANGLEGKAPFDGIHVSAAYDEMPRKLLAQLKIGAHLVAPTTDHKLHIYERTSATEFTETVHKAYFFDTIQAGIE